MGENIIGIIINGVQVIGAAYMDGNGQEIYECLEDGEHVYLSYDEIICEKIIYFENKEEHEQQQGFSHSYSTLGK